MRCACRMRARCSALYERCNGCVSRAMFPVYPIVRFACAEGALYSGTAVGALREEPDAPSSIPTHGQLPVTFIRTVTRPPLRSTQPEYLVQCVNISIGGRGAGHTIPS